MLMVISPAKTLDYQGRSYDTFTVPSQLAHSQVLVDQLRDLGPAEIGKLMKISPKLADLNVERYDSFSMPFTPNNAKQALLVFKGDVYKGMDVEHYDAQELAYAQAHLRILSGLYGVLRPLDLMQPYRLEMGTKLKNSRGKDLYAFWGEKIAIALNQALEKSQSGWLVNLASNEYFKAIDQTTLAAKVLNIAFKENKGGLYKVIAIHAKRARGLMVNYAVKHQLQDIQALKDFDSEGYRYSQQLSTEAEWVFCRD